MLVGWCEMYCPWVLFRETTIGHQMVKEACLNIAFHHNSINQVDHNVLELLHSEKHHYKPRSKVVPEPQNQKHTLPQPERQVKAKKPEH